MKLSRAVKTAKFFVLIWGGVAIAFVLIVTFPVASKFALVGLCAPIVLFSTWKLAETYVND